MTKAELGDAVLLLKGYSNQDAKLDVRLVWVLADVVIPKLIEAKIKNDGEDIVDLFTKPFILPILQDAQTEKMYVELPTSPIAVNGKLIREISETKGDSNSFAIQKIGEKTIYSKLEAGNALGKTIATPEGRKVYLQNVGVLVDEVLVRYIPKITGIQKEDDIPVPPDYEDDLLNLILAKLNEQKQTKEDKYNDSEQLDWWNIRFALYSK